MNTTDYMLIALYDSLDGYIQFRDEYHVKKSLQENNPHDKTHPLSDETRTHADVKTRITDINKSTKDTEVSNSKEENSKYPEITSTAGVDFICNLCGKPFLTPDDLKNHQKFEGSQKQDY
jgi:hypothetical protein